jgi:hypothetical protein
LQQTSDHYPKSFIYLLFLFALTRFPLLWFNQAEFTDAYILFSWSWRNGDKWHPLYPILIHMMDRIFDPILAGRFISAVCGLLTLPILWSITNRLYGKRSALFSCCLFFVSPQLLWIQTRVLTESLFVLVALAALFYFVRLWKENHPWDFCLLLFFSGLSLLTRPEGLVFLPLILLSLMRIIWHGRSKQILFSLPSLVPWILFAIWFQMRSSGANYQSELLFSLQTLSLGKCLLYIVSYLEVYPYILTYPIFLLFLFHAGKKSETRNGIWLFTLIYIHIVWFGILALHWAWTPRFLIFPSVLLLAEAAAKLSKLEKRLRRNVWMALFISVLAFSLLFAASVLYLQRGTYADVKDSALFVRNKRTNQRIFSDEYFKVSYYLGTPVIFYSRSATFQPGDIVILHSFHTPLRNEVIELSRRYKLSFVYSTSSTTMPLLANGLVAKSADNNLPLILQQRFTVQKFDSIVLQILALK